MVDFNTDWLNSAVLQPVQQQTVQPPVDPYFKLASGITPLQPGYVGPAYYAPPPTPDPSMAFPMTQAPLYSMTPFEGGELINVHPAGGGGFGDFFGGISGMLSGGLTDMLKGNAIGTGSTEFLSSILPEGTLGGQVLSSLLDPANSAMSDIGKGFDKGGSAIDVFSNTFDRMADPTNSVNYSLESGGSRLPESVRSVLPTVGAVVGSAVYPVAGTALGYGIGAHMAGKNSTQALTGAGMSAIASGISQGLSPELTAGDLNSINLGDAMANEGAMQRAAELGIDMQSGTPITDAQYDYIFGNIDPNTVQGGAETIYADYMSGKALDTPLSKGEINWVNNENYMNSQPVQDIYTESQNHPGAKYMVEGEDVNAFSSQTPEDMYGNLKPAPPNPELDYPLVNGKIPYATPDPGAMYGNPYGTLEQFNAQESSWLDDWQKYLKYANKLLGPMLQQEGAGTPGYMVGGGGGGTLDLGGMEGGGRKKNNNASNLGMEMLEGSMFPLGFNPNFSLEDYIQ